MIIVYGRHEGCPACDDAKTYLKMRNIEYNFIDIDQNPDARDFILSKGFRTIPVMFRDSELLGVGMKALDKL